MSRLITVTRKGCLSVPGENIAEALDYLKNTSPDDFHWEDFSETLKTAQVTDNAPASAYNAPSLTGFSVPYWGGTLTLQVNDKTDAGQPCITILLTTGASIQLVHCRPQPDPDTWFYSIDTYCSVMEQNQGAYSLARGRISSIPCASYPDLVQGTERILTTLRNAGVRVVADGTDITWQKNP